MIWYRARETIDAFICMCRPRAASGFYIVRGRWQRERCVTDEQPGRGSFSVGRQTRRECASIRELAREPLKKGLTRLCANAGRFYLVARYR